jgi:hypothetical protein
MSDATKPAARVIMYPVKAAIWKNEHVTGEVFYSATFERSYRDNAGEWQSSDNYGIGELLLLAKVADLAHTEIVKLRAKDRKAQKTEE